jgi:hypothetical protein
MQRAILDTWFGGEDESERGISCLEGEGRRNLKTLDESASAIGGGLCGDVVEGTVAAEGRGTCFEPAM